MTPTDDKRLLVAVRLRLVDMRNATDLDCLIAEAVRGREFCEAPCEDCQRRLLGELANLIEPAPKCDRERLLELADELETDGVDHYIVSTQYVCDQYARRIREALGVVE